MLTYEIPGRDVVKADNIVFDYNGTIAVRGQLIKEAAPLINQLAQQANVYILTADTYGTVEGECRELNAAVRTFPKENAGAEKQKIVKELGGSKTICVGNGFNDLPMFAEAVLSIAILEAEGVSGKLLMEADIVVRSILEALEILLNPNTVKATLRN